MMLPAHKSGVPRNTPVNFMLAIKGIKPDEQFTFI